MGTYYFKTTKWRHSSIQEGSDTMTTQSYGRKCLTKREVPQK